jgi:hypothetical protein
VTANPGENTSPTPDAAAEDIAPASPPGDPASTSSAGADEHAMRFGSTIVRMEKAAKAGGGDTRRSPLVWGGLSSTLAARAWNHESTRRTNAGSRCDRFVYPIRPLLVSRLKANWIGSKAAYREASSK